jgi:hypothetical protein
VQILDHGHPFLGVTQRLKERPPPPNKRMGLKLYRGTNNPLFQSEPKQIGPEISEQEAYFPLSPYQLKNGIRKIWQNPLKERKQPKQAVTREKMKTGFEVERIAMEARTIEICNKTSAKSK